MHNHTVARVNGQMKSAAFSFGLFTCDEFGQWMGRRFDELRRDLCAIAARYPAAVRKAGLPQRDHSDMPLSQACDVAYLAILSLGLRYSVHEDVIDGKGTAQQLLAGEPLKRARFMLQDHLQCHPARLTGDADCDTTSLERRAALVGQVLVPVAAGGLAGVKNLRRSLPLALRSRLRQQHQDETPLSEFTMTAFFHAFSGFVPKSDKRYWEPLLTSFWKPWHTGLGAVSAAIGAESLEEPKVRRSA